MRFEEDFYAKMVRERRYASYENASARMKGKVKSKIGKKWNERGASWFMGCNKCQLQFSPPYHPNY